MKNTKRIFRFCLMMLTAAVALADVAAFRTSTQSEVKEIYAASLYGETWISLNHFFKNFGDLDKMDTDKWFIEGTLAGKKYIFFANSSFYKLNNTWRHMPVTVERLGNGLYVSLKEFTYILEQDAFPEITYSIEKNEYILSASKFSVTDVNVRQMSNGTIIRIRTAKPFIKEHCSVWHGQNQYLYVSIYGATADLNYLNRKIPSGVIREIHPVMAQKTLQLNIKLRKKIDGFDYYLDRKSGDLMISLRHEARTKPMVNLNDYKTRWLIDTVVIDAGHGGRDPGAIGPDGTYEKDIALDIALRLGTILEKKTDIEVVYTRDKDIFIPLWQRPKIANEAHGKLFISIHCNASESSRPYGSETYLLAPKSTPKAIEIAARENQVIELESDQERYEKMLLPQQYILATMAQSAFMKESEILAQGIEKTYNDRIGNRTRGVKQANFIVLIGASMPSILTEVGFISNWNDLGKLKKGSYRQEIAHCLYLSIETFKEKYEKQITEY